MRYARPVASIVILVAVSVAQGQLASQAVVRELTGFKDQLLKAEVDRDTFFLQQAIADDFVYVKTQGEVMNKEQLLARVRSPEHSYEFLKSDSVVVRRYGDVAIMTDRTSTKGAINGRAFGGDFRFVRVFVRKNTRWQVVLEQGTPIQDSAAQK